MPDAYSVALTPGALADIDRLDRFLRDRNPAAANRLLDTFTTAFVRLAENPLDSPLNLSSMLRARIVPFGRRGYVCLYAVRGRTVIVVRLFHTRENWQAESENAPS
jgi:plasmid stabilization system protein ParE